MEKCAGLYYFDFKIIYVGQGGAGGWQLSADKDEGPLRGLTRLGPWVGLVEPVLRRSTDTTSPTKGEVGRVRDDVSLLGTYHTTEKLERTTATVLEDVSRWIDNHDLELVATKTEAIVLMGRRAFNPPP